MSTVLTDSPTAARQTRQTQPAGTQTTQP